MLKIFPVSGFGIKKIGATLIVAVLVVMMAVTFSSQPLGEILAVISGGRSPGSFAGEEISSRLIAGAEDGCKRRYSAFGQLPDFFINQCVDGEIRTLYVVPAIGENFGLSASEKSVKSDLIKQVKEEVRMQKALSHDDRLSVEEIYQRSLIYYPLPVRVRQATIMNVLNNIGENYPYPIAMYESNRNENAIKMNVRIVRYNESSLLTAQGKELHVSDAELKLLYDKEQSTLSAKDRRPFEDQKPFIENRVKDEKRQTLLAGVKGELNKLKDRFTLDQVVAVSKVRATDAGRLSLRELISSPSVKLSDPELLERIGKASNGDSFVAGPIQDGDSTLYVEISRISIDPALPVDVKRDPVYKDMERTHAITMLDYLVKEEAVRGKFHINRAKGNPIGGMTEGVDQ